ncbi:MAG: lasso peptide biosynthesis B2 protein [Gammaproteobacteria bacterium]
MSTYLLAKHAYLCVADNHVVFLDLRRDQYSAIDPAEAPTLRNLVRGWPVGPDTLEVPPSQETLQQLLDDGLLTEDCEVGKDAAPVQLPEPRYELHSARVPLLRVAPRHYLNMTLAWLTVTYQLRYRPLEETVLKAKRRSELGRADFPFDPQRAAPLIAIYRTLQPRLFSPIDACLRNSLTLLQFLSRYGLFPTWTFGVRMEPPASNLLLAHSWLQQQSIVLNDTVHHIRQYVPILAV